MICSIKVRHLEDDRFCFCHFPAFYLVALVVKNPPAMREMRVWSLGQEDPLEKIMATHSSILAWEIPWTEEPGGVQSMESQRVMHDWVTNTYTNSFKVRKHCTYVSDNHLAYFELNVVEELFSQCFLISLVCLGLTHPSQLKESEC